MPFSPPQNGPSRLLNFAKLTHFISDIDGVYEEFATIPVNMPKYDELPSGVEDKNRYVLGVADATNGKNSVTFT